MLDDIQLYKNFHLYGFRRSGMWNVNNTRGHHSEIGSCASIDYNEFPGLPCILVCTKGYCFCQNVTVFQNVSRESRA